jgi:hypothetical protein
MAQSARNAPWSREEVEATVGDYFRMLTLELSGQSYNKAEHRRALMKRLSDRSEPAVELKHQNISAILIEIGCPFIDGYKPRGNYQSLLFDVVEDRVAHDALFNQAALDAVERSAVAPIVPKFESILEDAPDLKPRAQSSNRPYERPHHPVQRDYLSREARNRALGRAGEELVVALERDRLFSMGKKKLADRVEHVAVTKGDGLGFDVLSFDTTGRDRFIEVKTTAFGKETPFYLSKGELEFSKSSSNQFFLYRLFAFRRDPRLFTIAGAVDRHCLLDPVSFLARFS